MRKIEIITFTGCDTSARLVEELQTVQEKHNFDLETSLVPSADMSEEMGLFGSPTVMVNGKEFQKDPGANSGFY